MTRRVHYIDLLPAEQDAFTWLDDHLDLADERQVRALDTLAAIVQDRRPAPGPTAGAWTDMLEALLIEAEPDLAACAHLAALTRLVAAYLRTTTGMTWQQARRPR